LLASMGRMTVSKSVFLRHKGDNRYVLELAKGVPAEPLSETLVIASLPQQSFFTTDVHAGDHPWVAALANWNIHLWIPLRFQDSLLGLLGFGPKASGAGYNENEIAFLTSLANIAATSIANSLVYEELKQVNLRLDRKVQELNTLFDIGKELNAALDAQKIMQL